MKTSKRLMLGFRIEMAIRVATRLLHCVMGYFRRKQKYQLPEISNEPGWEGSDEAYLLASNIVFEMANKLEIPWFKPALKRYLSNLAKNKTKVRDEDLSFIQLQTSKVWDLFRTYMMSPEVNGRWSSEARSELSDLFADAASHAPYRYQPPNLEQFDKAQLTCLSLEVCLVDDKQILANAIFEVVEVIWCHHLDENPRRLA